jgi:hypothetical protein
MSYESIDLDEIDNYLRELSESEEMKLANQYQAQTDADDQEHNKRHAYRNFRNQERQRSQKRKQWKQLAREKRQRRNNPEE